MGRCRYIITDGSAPFPDLYRAQLAAHFHPPRHGADHPGRPGLAATQQGDQDIWLCDFRKSHALHCILEAPDLRQQIHDFKAFTAKEILRYLEENKAERLLEQLAFFKKAHKTDSRYQFWEEGSHPQLVQNEEMLRQKLEYIHLNPVKRGYVEGAVHWRYSSARNYQGQEGLIPVCTNWWR